MTNRTVALFLTLICICALCSLTGCKITEPYDRNKVIKEFYDNFEVFEEVAKDAESCAKSGDDWHVNMNNVNKIYREGDPEFFIFSLGYWQIFTLSNARPYLFFSLQFVGEQKHSIIYIDDEEYAPVNPRFKKKYQYKYEKLAEHWYIEEENENFSPPSQTDEEIIQEFKDNFAYFEAVASQGKQLPIYAEGARVKRFGTEECDEAVDKLFYDLNYFNIQTLNRSNKTMRSMVFYKLLIDKWVEVRYWDYGELPEINDMEQNIFGNWYVEISDIDGTIPRIG